MSELSEFGKHARAMSTRQHTEPCPWVNPAKAKRDSGRAIWQLAEDQSALHLVGFEATIPACPGCVTDADRALWARLADEVDAYLQEDEEPGLFGAPYTPSESPKRNGHGQPVEKSARPQNPVHAGDMTMKQPR